MVSLCGSLLLLVAISIAISVIRRWVFGQQERTQGCQGNVCSEEFLQEPSVVRKPMGTACQTLVLLGLLQSSFSISPPQGAIVVAGELLWWVLGEYQFKAMTFGFVLYLVQILFLIPRPYLDMWTETLLRKNKRPKPFIFHYCKHFLVFFPRATWAHRRGMFPEIIISILKNSVLRNLFNKNSVQL